MLLMLSHGSSERLSIFTSLYKVIFYLYEIFFLHISIWEICKIALSSGTGKLGSR